MSLDVASQYLSVDEATFHRIAKEHHVERVDLGDDAPRWKKSDLDRLSKRLPASSGYAALGQKTDKLAISDADIERLAIALARHLAGAARHAAPELVSIKEAGRLLGLGRSTIYRLINEDRLQTRRIGSRTLVTRAAIAAILQDGSV